MRVLNQFKTLFVKVTDGIVGARPSPGFDCAGDGPSAQREPVPGDQRVAHSTQIAHDDGNRPPPSNGSHPAVWPR